MGAGQKRNRVLIPQAAQAMYDFKYEIAQELGVADQIQGGYWGNISSRDCGSVGGNMVRKMIAYAEQQLTSNAGAVMNQPLIGNTNSRNLAANQGQAATTGMF